MQRWTLSILSALLATLTLPVVSTNANASDARVVVVGATPLVGSDQIVHHMITTTLDVALTSKNQRGLNAFIASLSDRSSSNYHAFLTPRAYATRFGAPRSAVRAVAHYLERYGLTVGALSAGHNLLHVTGTTREISHAFSAGVETVRLSDGALDAHLTSSATLPRAIAGDVVGIAGLSTVQPESANVVTRHAPATASATAHVTTAGSCPSAGSSSGTTPNSLGGYTVQQQAGLYGFRAAWSNGDTGVGQTIGIYELASYVPSDVATYLACYGVTSNVTAVNIDGGPTLQDSAGGATDEATLDVEEAQVLAPGARVVIYQGTQAGSGPLDIYSAIASADVATVVTTSWGICEAQTTGSAQAEQPIFEEMAAQGQTVVAAAGDNGSSDCESATVPSTALAVDDPASQPLVTGVGGLTVSSLSPIVQRVWNDGCTQSNCGSGGGGVSSLWTQPTWQQAPGITTSPASGGMRMVPDLSVMADPATGFIQYYTGTSSGTCAKNCASGWGNIGGTSIGAPLVSALVALGAQTCGSRLGLINPSLYSMASTGYTDVTAGNNNLYGVGGYSAAVGYDMASGLGSPNGAAFLAGLCPATVAGATSSFTLSATSSPTSGSGPRVSATLRDAAGNAVANAVVQVSASAASGVVTINGNTASANGAGQAATALSSDASGVVSFNVTSSVAQNVRVTVTYDSATIYSTAILFRAVASNSRPAPPSIVTLRPVIGGFVLTVAPPTRRGTLPVTAFQYSLNGGASWITISRGATTVSVVRLRRGASYLVRVRDLNAAGPSPASAPRRVVTRS